MTARLPPTGKRLFHKRCLALGCIFSQAHPGYFRIGISYGRNGQRLPLGRHSGNRFSRYFTFVRCLMRRIGLPTTSPIAKICFTLLRCCLSTLINPRSSTLTPALSASIKWPLGRLPTATNTLSNTSDSGASLPLKLTFKPSAVPQCFLPGFPGRCCRIAF